MQCHTDGGSLVWDWKAHDEMSDAFADIAGDREIKVLIHTGTGENYNANWGPATNEKPLYLAMDGQKGLEKLDEKAWYGRMLIENHGRSSPWRREIGDNRRPEDREQGTGDQDVCTRN